LKAKSILLNSLRGYRASYSQAGQDAWVAQEVFNEEKGLFFVEAGAYDGIGFSNTYLLELRYCWQGICIEANPRVYGALQKNRSCKSAQRLLGRSKATKRLYLQDMGSTVTKQNEGEFVSMECTSLAEVLFEFKAPKTIDYLSLDIEGSEDEVLGEFTFDKYVFRCATIERLSEDGKKELRSQGYILIKEVVGLDAFFVHESHFKDYVKNMFCYYEKTRYILP
jgi:FkbM family methyltransferase